MDSVTTPSVQITEDLIETLVGAGGYTHSLFRAGDPARRPLPGQAVLLLMGGLVEQSGVLDHAVALLEMRSVRFNAMVRPGTRLRVEVDGAAPEPTREGRARQWLTWTAYDEEMVVAEAEVLMLVRAADEGGGR